MPPENLPDFSAAKLISGVAGAFVSLRFMQGTAAEKLIMAVGGAALSYFATTPVAQWLAMQQAEGLVGFLLGLFGMSIATKVYEVIQLMDARRIAADLWEWLTRKWRA